MIIVDIYDNNVFWVNCLSKDIPKRNGLQQIINRYSDYGWTYNFLGQNEDFSDYGEDEALKNPPTLPLCHCGELVSFGIF